MSAYILYQSFVFNFALISVVLFISINLARISEGSVSKISNKRSFSEEESSLNVYLELFSAEDNVLTLLNAPFNPTDNFNVKRIRRLVSVTPESNDEDYDDDDFEGKTDGELKKLFLEKLELEENSSTQKNSEFEGESELLGSQTMEDLRELEIFAKNAKKNIMRTHQTRVLELQTT